jgi:hypothetical protein
MSVSPDTLPGEGSTNAIEAVEAGRGPPGGVGQIRWGSTNDEASTAGARTTSVHAPHPGNLGNPR